MIAGRAAEDRTTTVPARQDTTTTDIARIRDGTMIATGTTIARPRLVMPTRTATAPPPPGMRTTTVSDRDTRARGGTSRRRGTARVVRDGRGSRMRRRTVSTRRSDAESSEPPVRNGMKACEVTALRERVRNVTGFKVQIRS